MQNLNITVFQEMGIDIKITQPNSMILVFFSAEVSLTHDVNRSNTLSSQGN